MRKKKPRRASPDEVKISRSEEEAIIAFADATIAWPLVVRAVMERV